MKEFDIKSNNELKRELSSFSATMLVIASMIGTGIFTTSGFIIMELANPQAMLWCWVVGGVFALSGALCYAELGVMFPKAGGEYVFLKESFGKPMAFLSGWISMIVGFSAPIAAASIAFSTYFQQTFPAYDASPGNISIMAIGVIILFSLIHYHSLSTGSKIQDFLTIFKIALILVFIGLGLSIGEGSISHFSSQAPQRIIFSEDFAISLIFISYAYSGWNAATYLGSEVKNPAKTIPIALVTGTLVVIMLYLLLNIVYIYALPVEKMSGVLAVGTLSSMALFGEESGRLFSAAIAVCLISVIGAMILTGPRVYYAMAQDKVFFNAFGRTSKSYHTPGYSILLQAILAIVMVITVAFDTLLIYIGFTLSIFAMFTVVGMIVLRYKKQDQRRDYRTLGYPVTPVIFILGNLWIIYVSISSKPIISLFGLGTIAAGILFYQIFRKCKS